MIQHLYRTYQLGVFLVDAIDTEADKTQYWLYRLDSSVKIRLEDTVVLDAEEERNHVFDLIHFRAKEYEERCYKLCVDDERKTLEDYINTEHSALLNRMTSGAIDSPLHQKIYYAVPGVSLYYSLTDHDGILTEKDVMDNMRKAIYRSNENGEDWIAVLKLRWYNTPGMIMNSDEETLLDEDTIEFYIKDMVDIYSSDRLGLTEYCRYNVWGIGKQLEPLDKEQLSQLDEMDDWTIYSLMEDIPYESPYC